nr:hypothetical protein [Armatimonas sp.]
MAGAFGADASASAFDDPPIIPEGMEAGASSDTDFPADIGIEEPGWPWQPVRSARPMSAAQ